MASAMRSARGISARGIGQGQTSGRRYRDYRQGMLRALPEEDHADDGAEQAEEEGVEVELQVTGMKCDGCKQAVQSALEGTEGVTGAEVDLDSGVARVFISAATMMDAMQQTPSLVDAVQGAGFGAEPNLG